MRARGIAVAATAILLTLAAAGSCGAPSYGFRGEPADAAADARDGGPPIGPDAQGDSASSGLSPDAEPCMCATVPGGWTGPVALYEGPGAVPPPSCAGTYGSQVFQGNTDLQAPGPSCTECACGPQHGAKCGAHLTYYTDPCGQTLGGCNSQDYGLLAGTCQKLGTVDGQCAGRVVESFSADEVESQPGACSASGGARNGAPPSWNTAAEACAATAPFVPGGCDAGELCVPPPAAPFERLCIEAEGAQACPAGSPFAVVYLFYTAAEDTRSCTGCSCSSPTVACGGGGSASFYSDAQCTVKTGTVQLNNLNGMCESLAGSSYYSKYDPMSLSLGTCTPVGGLPQGAVVPSTATAVTFCCTE